MCGISGVFSKNPLTEDQINKGKKILNSLNHRGPDNKNYLINKKKNLFFGHNRLSIIYPHKEGNQPLTEDKNQIIFNGEIYNYKYLGQKYFNKKISDNYSDTEILLKSWIKWKENFYEYIDGMYAFGIYDGNYLKLVTDYFGEKPIYYFLEEEVLYFSSEIKPLLKVKKFPELEAVNLDIFLKNGFLPNGLTPFKNIFKVKSNSILKINNDLRVSEQRLHKIEKGDQRNFSENDFEDFSNIMIETVKSRLVSDTSISLLLSSGSDSSLIAAISKKELNYDLLTISLKNNKSDETDLIKGITNNLNLENLVIENNHINESILDNCALTLNDNIEAFGIDNLTSILKSKNNKVTLSGLGADEIFYGYNKYEIALKYINPSFFKRISYFIKSKLKKNFYNKNFDPYKFLNQNNYQRFNYLKNQMEFKDYGNSKNIDDVDFSMKKDFLFNLRNFDLFQTLPYSFLPSSDFASMANSVELRSPYLNLNLLKFINKFDQKALLKKPRKFFIKKLLSTYLPEKLINKKKIGFRFDNSNFEKINKLNNINFKYNNTFTEIQPYVKSNKNNFFNRLVILNKLYNFYDENLSCQQ
jgi:asparagine synthase (glutamine-hydrolysing)